jgi:cell division protein ZapA
MKQIEVEIMGQSYRLSCPEGGESRLQDAVQRVDTAMCKIRDNSKIRARDRIAVLAALNLAFDTAAQEAISSTPAASVAPTTSANDAPNDDRLKSLIQRLDSALGADGRLI